MHNPPHDTLQSTPAHSTGSDHQVGYRSSSPPPSVEEALSSMSVSSGADENYFPTKTENMLPCTADFAIYPLGTTTSLTEVMREVEAILKRQGIPYEVHPESTSMKGDMMALMYAIKTCHEAIMAMSSCTRVVSNIRVDTRSDGGQQFKEA